MKQEKRVKHTCSECGGNKFSYKDGGALLICKGCGNILKDHIENIEQDFENILHGRVA